MPRSVAALMLALGLLLPAAHVALSHDAACVPPALDGPEAALSRTDHQVSGNRVAPGCGPLAADGFVDVELTGTPTWVLPDPSDRGDSWLVVLEDGSVELVVAPRGGAPFISRSEVPPLEPGDPPLAAALSDEQIVVGSALGASRWFDDAIPHARVVQTADGTLIALSGPTDRYDHGVLGDDIEASAIALLDAAGGRSDIEIGSGDVVEGTSPLLLEALDGERGPVIIATLSNADSGARLVAYDLAGEQLASSEPIGEGYRWLHQVGAGPLGPNGEQEIIVVRTPHLGGIVEAYRPLGDGLEKVAETPGYSSHRAGSSNLDMALLADVDGDGRLEVVVPTQAFDALGVLARTDEGFERIETFPLAGELTTNVAATPDAEGGLVLAVGAADGRLRIFR